MWNRTSLGLLLGSALAGFGAWIDLLAILSLAAYVHGAGGALMAFVSGLFLLPALLIGPAVGRWVDRRPAAGLLVATLLLRSLATLLLVLQGSIVGFCALVALRSVLNTATEPASNVLVSQHLVRESVARYFAVLGVLRNASKIAAPALGAGIASVWGEVAAVVLAAVLTLLGAAAVWLSGAAEVAREAPSVSAAAKPGATTASPLLRQLLWTVTVYAAMVFALNNQLPVLLREAGFDKALLGLLVSCSGAGGVLAAAWMSRLGARVDRVPPMTLTTLGVLATAACFIGLGVAFALPRPAAEVLAGALFFCTGAFASLEAIRANTVVVQGFAGQVGAVSARLAAWQSGAMLLSPWATAALLPQLPVPALFALDGGLGFLLVAGGALFFRRAVRATAPA